MAMKTRLGSNFYTACVQFGFRRNALDGTADLNLPSFHPFHLTKAASLSRQSTYFGHGPYLLSALAYHTNTHQSLAHSSEKVAISIFARM